MEVKKLKKKRCSNVYQGEEIAFKKIPEVFKSCWIHNGAAEITSDVMLIKMMNEKDSPLKSVLLYEDDIPIVTKRKTSKLIDSYSKKECVDGRIIKCFTNDIYGKSSYKRPYISPDAMFVPILDDSNKNVSYINLAMVNNIYSNEKGKTVIAFCGCLEVSVDMKFAIVKKTVERWLEIYAMYYECDNVFCINPFEKWNGKYYQLRKDIIQKAIESAKEDRVAIIKNKYHFMFKSTDTDKMEIAEIAFYS